MPVLPKATSRRTIRKKSHPVRPPGSGAQNPHPYAVRSLVRVPRLLLPRSEQTDRVETGLGEGDLRSASRIPLHPLPPPPQLRGSLRLLQGPLDSQGSSRTRGKQSDLTLGPPEREIWSDFYGGSHSGPLYPRLEDRQSFGELSLPSPMLIPCSPMLITPNFFSCFTADTVPKHAPASSGHMNTGLQTARQPLLFSPFSQCTETQIHQLPEG